MNKTHKNIYKTGEYEVLNRRLSPDFYSNQKVVKIPYSKRKDVKPILVRHSNQFTESYEKMHPYDFKGSTFYLTFIANCYQKILNDPKNQDKTLYTICPGFSNNEWYNC